MPRKADTPQLNVRLEADMLADLKALSVVSGESMNALALEALQEYLWARPEAIEAGKQIMSGWSAYKNATKASKDPTGLLLAQIRGGGTATAPADASENKTAAAQAPGSEAQGAQAEAAQAPVPAEPAQTEQEQTADMPQASPVPSDSGQVASSSPVDMQQAAGAQAPVPAMQDAQDSEPADMQESADTADAAEAGDSSQDVQDGSSMAEQLGQDAAQNSGQDATTAQGLPVQGSLLASLRRMVRENAAQDAGQDAGDAGPSIEELKARARELKAQGLTQSQIAREIGKSEASVSRYLKSAK